MSVTPLVAPVGGPGQTLTITLPEVAHESVVVRPVDAVSVLLDGSPVVAWALFDNGTHGDETAGDRVFTRAGLMAGGNGALRSASVTAASFVVADTATLWVPTKFSLRSVDTLAIRPVDAWNVAPDIQVTDYVVAVVSPEDDAMTEMVDVGNRYYTFFPGDRDFLFVTVGARPSSASGVSVATASPIRGIGEPRISGYRITGAGILMRIVVLYQDGWRDRGRWDGAFCLVTHELAHAWAAFLHEGLSAGGHWTEKFLRSRSAFGVDGACVFNELENYLAGLVPADSVQGALTATGMTIADVVAREGPRIPAWPDAKRRFTAAAVVSTRVPLERWELAYFNALAREYGMAESSLGLTFEGATGGRARLDLRIPSVR